MTQNQSNPNSTAATAPATPAQPVTSQPNGQPAATGSPAPAKGELSGGATAAIGTGIGVGNICCSPFCYGCPTLLSSIVGLILYFSWKQEKPKTAHTILVVTLVTGGIGLVLFAIMFVMGLAGTILDELNY